MLEGLFPAEGDIWFVGRVGICSEKVPALNEMEPNNRSIGAIHRYVRKEEGDMNMPGFDAELSLSSTTGRYQGNPVLGGLSSDSSGEILPQFRFQAQSDPDWGAYWRCRANGGSEAICRFFGGLPPFTIGGLRFTR